MKTADIDLSKMTAKELEKLQKKAAREIEKRKKDERKQVLQELRALARERGYSLNEVLPEGAGSKGSKQVKYRHPEDPSKTWTGLGRKPKWVVEWENNGGNLEDLRA